VGLARPFRIGVFWIWLAALAGARTAQAISVGGDISYTSDYIFRGISESGGHSAGQLDLHLASSEGTFIGVFATSLGRLNGFGWDAELDTYLGHRFDLSASWSTTVTLTDYVYLGGNVPTSNDYQELSLAVSYLDRCTLTVTASPNTVRYEQEYLLGRYASYNADVATQLPLAGRLFATAGAGYYTVAGPMGTGYVYGNAGFAYEFKDLRLDVGLYGTAKHEQPLYPYGRAANRLAATLSYHF
jgi:uncharacterized protein (TIGR02001 family)